MTSVLSVLVFFCFIIGNTDANPNFSGPLTTGETIPTVKATRFTRENCRVYLEGNIIEQTDSEIYFFQDMSGTISLEIEAGDWSFDFAISPEIPVGIYGRIDINDFGEREVEVDHIDLL